MWKRAWIFFGSEQPDVYFQIWPAGQRMIDVNQSNDLMPMSLEVVRNSELGLRVPCGNVGHAGYHLLYQPQLSVTSSQDLR